jgi:hypothetical protein
MWVDMITKYSEDSLTIQHLDATLLALAILVGKTLIIFDCPSNTFHMTEVLDRFYKIVGANKVTHE